MRTVPCPADGILLQMRRSALFRDVDEKTCRFLAETARLLEFARGEVLAAAGSAAEEFFVILSGRVKASRSLRGGRERVIAVHGPESVAGLGAMFRMQAYPADLSAVEDCRVLAFGRKSLYDAVRTSPDLALSLAGVLAMRLRMLTMRIGAEGGSAESRLAGFLLHRSAMENSETFSLSMAREEMASMLGVARETLSRALSRLASRGAVVVDRRVISIADRSELELILAEGEEREHR